MRTHSYAHSCTHMHTHTQVHTHTYRLRHIYKHAHTYTLVHKYIYIPNRKTHYNFIPLGFISIPNYDPAKYKTALMLTIQLLIQIYKFAVILKVLMKIWYKNNLTINKIYSTEKWLSFSVLHADREDACCRNTVRFGFFFT